MNKAEFLESLKLKYDHVFECAEFVCHICGNDCKNDMTCCACGHTHTHKAHLYQGGCQECMGKCCYCDECGN